jgi:cellulase/cellobiase CelA1
MDNPHIVNLGPKSGSVAALGGAEVYKALGAGSNITYWSDIQDGNHCAIRPEWKTPLTQNIQKYLTKTGSAAGSFHISSSASGRLSDWIDWTTPTLGTGPTTPPPTTPPPTTPPPATPPPTTPPPGNGGCTATVSLNSWTGGYVATVRVTAGTSPINGWRVAVTLPAGSTISNAWNTNRTGNSGAVQFTDVNYNGQLAAGAYTEFGFQATGTSSAMTPTCGTA